MIIRIPGQVWHWVLTSPLVKPARRGDGGEWIPRWNLRFVNEVNLVEISFSRPLSADDTNKNLRDDENEVKTWKQDILIYHLTFDNNPVVHLFAEKTEKWTDFTSLPPPLSCWVVPAQLCGKTSLWRRGGRKGGVLAAVSGTGNLWWDIFTFSTSSSRIMVVEDKSKQWLDSGLVGGGGQRFYEQCLKTVELVPRGSILTKCRDH